MCRIDEKQKKSFRQISNLSVDARSRSLGSDPLWAWPRWPGEDKSVRNNESIRSKLEIKFKMYKKVLFFGCLL